MSDKVAVITGASSGLGRAMVARFRENGFVVVGVCRSTPENELDLWIQADITTDEGRSKILNTISEKYGRLDLLVNNAGKGSYATWEEMSEADLRDIFELNFFAPVRLTQQLLPLLQQSKGSIINISSIAGKLYVPCMGAYCATKAAFNLYTDTLRTELRKSGVSVMKVMPGRVDTGFSSRALGARKPPETPGGACADKFADKVFRAYRKKRRYLIFPSWYKLILAVPKLLPGLYERKNIEMWGL